jgi:hypothetical protein
VPTTPLVLDLLRPTPKPKHPFFPPKPFCSLSVLLGMGTYSTDVFFSTSAPDRSMPAASRPRLVSTWGWQGRGVGVWQRRKCAHLVPLSGTARLLLPKPAGPHLSDVNLSHANAEESKAQVVDDDAEVDSALAKHSQVTWTKV